MKPNENFLYCIIGLGSVGKKHAKYYSNLKGELIFIDPLESVYDWAQNNINRNFKYFKKINKAESYITRNKLPKLAIISNWGNQHYSSLLELNQMGIKKFFIEKPVANSIYQIDSLLNMAKNKKIEFVAGFGWRYSGLPEKIKEISCSHLGGDPKLISMTGGAFGMVTNGIHFLDLAISIFESEPISVFSNLKSDKINPRSKELDFWQGVSSWSFSNNKYLIISSSNHSSVASTIEIVCPKGKIIINEDMSVSSYKRDESEIKNDPRVIRLGKASMRKGLNYIPDYSKAYDRLISPLLNLNGDKIINEEREVIATKSILYSLVSSKLEKQISINEKIDDIYYNKEWMIS